MAVKIINVMNNLPLCLSQGKLTDSEGNTFPIVNGVARMTDLDNYTGSFGLQWSVFAKTQLDREHDGLVHSERRFFAETGWKIHELNGVDILEVGSGAGRFSKIVLERTQAHLYSVDYSDAVSVNFENNGLIAPHRFSLFQASVYEMPFPDNSFDKVFCFGVLQHTPDFQASVKALIAKVKPGGELVVDFYPIKGWWTKIHAKYIFRPWTKRMKHDKLLAIIESNVDWLIRLSRFLKSVGLSIFTRFLPLVDLATLPSAGLTAPQYREWVVLDTFDMFSPEHDHPQRISDVVSMFNHCGVRVTFSGFVEYSKGFKAAVVRGIKQR